MADSEGAHTIVLVHGAFHGGWCWRRVADALREQGHWVFTPTLTGLGERSHQLDESVSLDTWIEDIVGVIESEELTDVLLVGHSLGGLTVSGVADRLPERLRALVYLDALLVPDGLTAVDMGPPGERERRAAAAGIADTDLALPPFPAASFGVVDPDDAAWLQRRMTPQPIRPYLDPVHLDHPLGNGLPCTYIACTSPIYPANDPSKELARSQPGWRWLELESGHNAMVTAPDALTAMLLDCLTARDADRG